MGTLVHITHLIKELIVLSNKAKILLGINSDSEPVVTARFDSQENCLITIKSTCFPFFTERGFYTFPESQLDLVVDKCRLFVSQLEKNVNLTVETGELLFEKAEKIKEKDIKSNRIPSILIHLDGKSYRYKILVCDKHKNNPNTRFNFTAGDCKCRLVREEEDTK